MKKFMFLLMVLMLGSCDRSEPIIIERADYLNTVDKVVEIMIHDIFSPPVASRIFAYPNIAAYEIVASNNKAYKSLSNQIEGLGVIPPPSSKDSINYQLAALVAHIDLSRRLVFSEDKISVYRDSLYDIWSNKDPEVFESSKKYGLAVADFFGDWMKTDNYNQTRTMPKFYVDIENEGRWQPTPPSYMEGIEPHWDKIRTLVMDSSSQFKPVPPPEFSMDENSQFYKELKEVYDISNKITENGDASEEVKIAQFWDCNPFVSVTRGHLMFATKKITPGAHWMGIAKIACKNEDLGFDDTIYVNTKTSIAIFDGFISCWDEKYRSNLVRPETLINTYINDNWKPILQTPPFPEYVSGHSVVSGAASTVLTSIFGDDYEFEDDTEVTFGIPVRRFKSFNAAAEEAALSRMYGGIHYRAAVEIGLDQGKRLGQLVVEKINMKNDQL